MSGENEQAYDLIHRYMHRPAEHLYHTSEDPYEMTNLVDDPKYGEVKARLSAELDRWMESQGDPGVALDTKAALQAARQAAAGPGKAKRTK
jgi:uncharacterized sulfatase